MRRATYDGDYADYAIRFQSTLSMRRATNCGDVALRTALFQSTLSMRRATQGFVDTLELLTISIHALHEESDGLLIGQIGLREYFNPRSP